MRASKPLISLGLGVFAFGVGYDIVHHDDAHTVPRVPMSVAASGAPATTTTSITATVYIANMLTGDEYRVPPRDHRDYVGYFAPPAGNYVYLVGKTRG